MSFWRKKDKAAVPPSSTGETSTLHSTNGEYGLQVLADPTNADLDIVFVHGLTGNRETTWSGKSLPLWPQELLSRDMPMARIMTFGYDADVVRAIDPASKNTVRDHGQTLATDLARKRSLDDCERRPLIFVAHSLGGLVCEQALLISRGASEEWLLALVPSTSGIIFLGTPHAGSNLADWASALTKFSCIARPTNKVLIDVLRPGSEMLVNIQQEFHRLLGQRQTRRESVPHIYCFFEEKDYAHGIGRIVPPHLAILTRYGNQGIHANHVDMTKFKDRNDQGYQAVSGQLRIWAKDIKSAAEQTDTEQLSLDPRPSGDRRHPVREHIVRDSEASGLSQYSGTSQGLKRKKEDSYMLPTQRASGSARVVWDKTTYRITRIPEEIDLPSLSQAIKSLFELKDNEFAVHSLAFDASDETGPRKKVATISFHTRPENLSSSRNELDEWSFDIPYSTNPTEHNSIYFDTHFKGFTPLSPTEGDKEYTVDCIFIHGWGGHANGSFKSSTSHYVWLRDSLPKDCPQLRIWTYGYDSRLTQADSIADMYDYAETFENHLYVLRRRTKANQRSIPIIFVVHDLGGLIFKEAIIRMSKSRDPDHRLNLESTYGAMFFGVPSRGMNMKDVASLIEGLPARNIFNLLDPELGHHLRDRQHKDFCKAFPYSDSIIVRFFELRKSPTIIQDGETMHFKRIGPSVLRVDRASATQGRPGETGDDYVHSLDCDHTGMIKFSESDRDSYVRVCAVVQDLVRDAKSVIEARINNGSGR